MCFCWEKPCAAVLGLEISSSCYRHMPTSAHQFRSTNYLFLRKIYILSLSKTFQVYHRDLQYVSYETCPDDKVCSHCQKPVSSHYFPQGKAIKDKATSWCILRPDFHHALTSLVIIICESEDTNVVLYLAQACPQHHHWEVSAIWE
jgi:hypothetical protein